MDTYSKFPEFSLTNQSGLQFDSSELNGKVVLSNFIFTNCTEYCSALTPIMLDQQKRLTSNKNPNDQFILLTFSVDPEHDTPEVLKNYSSNFKIDHSTWHFLTGNEQEVNDTITDGFKLSFGKVDKLLEHVHKDGSIHVHKYDVFHTNRVVLSDKNGNIRAYFNGINEWDANQVYNHIMNLLNE